MFHLLSRFLYLSRSYATVSSRVLSQNATYIPRSELDNQIDYIKSINDNNAQNRDWATIKNNVLSIRGNLNQKNIDAVMLKILVNSKNYIAATLFTEYLKSTNEDLPLGLINSILYMYAVLGKDNKLTKEQKTFILDTYKSLYNKYKVLDSCTCENLLHALCVINEWEKAQKVLDNIHLSSTPTHSAYSTLIATFFRLNKKKKAFEMIEQSIKYKRALQDVAYEEWLNYTLRKYKEKQSIAKHLDEVFKHVATNCTVITENTAKRFIELYRSLDWDAQLCRIRKSDGECSECNNTLDCMSLSDKEFIVLQQNVKDKLIIGSDILLKTTNEELKRFLDFVERVTPYDIVLDGLNICFALGKSSHVEKLHLLNHVVDYFLSKDKKIVVLGRQHMRKWNRKYMEKIASKAMCFFIDNLSQDDPFFITAAILSAPHTDIVSKDLLRGHHFNLRDESLKLLFKRWQWQHQWMVFVKGPEVNIQPPLKFTPCAQKKNTTWHLPFEKETAVPSLNMVNDGIPDLRSWLCLRRNNE